MYEYRARIVRVIDGDTVDAEVDLGFHISSRMKNLNETLIAAGHAVVAMHE